MGHVSDTTVFLPCFKKTSCLPQFGFSLRFPHDHAKRVVGDADEGQFPPDVLCQEHGGQVFCLDCEECLEEKEDDDDEEKNLPQCFVCHDGLGDFPLSNGLRYCALCLTSRRLWLGILYTSQHRIAPQSGYGDLMNDFTVRCLHWDRHEDMCQQIGARASER